MCLPFFVFKFVIVSYFVCYLVATRVPQLISPLLLSLFVIISYWVRHCFLFCLSLFVIILSSLFLSVFVRVPQLISPLCLSLFVTRTSCFPTLADTQFSHNCSSIFYVELNQLIKLSTRSSHVPVFEALWLFYLLPSFFSFWLLDSSSVHDSSVICPSLCLSQVSVDHQSSVQQRRALREAVKKLFFFRKKP